MLQSIFFTLNGIFFFGCALNKKPSSFAVIHIIHSNQTELRTNNFMCRWTRIIGIWQYHHRLPSYLLRMKTFSSFPSIKTKQIFICQTQSSNYQLEFECIKNTTIICRRVFRYFILILLCSSSSANSLSFILYNLVAVLLLSPSPILLQRVSYYSLLTATANLYYYTAALSSTTRCLILGLEAFLFTLFWWLWLLLFIILFQLLQ